MGKKSINPLLPFILCATSVFADEVEDTLEDREFQRALNTMAEIELMLGRTAFERIMATVTRSVSKSAWAQLFDAAEAARARSKASGVSLH